MRVKMVRTGLIGALVGGAVMAASTVAAELPPEVDLSCGGAMAVSPSLRMGRPYLAAQSPVLAEGSAYLDAVAKVAEQHLPGLEACYRDRLLARPGLTGQVVIHFGIDAEGGVTEQCISEDSIDDEVMVRCVNDLVKSGDYPHAASTPVDVSIPFVFKPGIEGGAKTSS